MKKVYILFADGFEEVEAITPVDLLRRAGIDVKMVSVTGNETVTGSHGISFKTDMLYNSEVLDGDMLVLPGGMPGTTHLKESEAVKEAVDHYHKNGKYLAAICAAPTVFGEMGLLNGKMATCYPGLESGLLGAMWPGDSYPVVVDGQFITSRGVGTAISFALKLIEILDSEKKSNDIGTSIVFK